MTPTTTTPSPVAVKRAGRVAGIAVVLGAAVAWAVLTFAVSPTNRTATVSGPTPSERHYANAIASLDDAQLAAAFGTEPFARATSTERVLRSVSPQDRRYVRAITALTPVQLRAAFRAVRP